MLIQGSNISILGYDPTLEKGVEETPTFKPLTKVGVFVETTEGEEIVTFNVIRDKMLQTISLTKGGNTETLFISNDVKIIVEEDVTIKKGDFVFANKSFGIKTKKLPKPVELKLRLNSGLNITLLKNH